MLRKAIGAYRASFRIGRMDRTDKVTCRGRCPTWVLSNIGGRSLAYNFTCQCMYLCTLYNIYIYIFLLSEIDKENLVCYVTQLCHILVSLFFLDAKHPCKRSLPSLLLLICPSPQLWHPSELYVYNSPVWCRYEGTSNQNVMRRPW